jgi:transposase
MEEGLLMSRREQNVYRVIEQFVNRKMRRKEAALFLNVTERTVTRLGHRIVKLGLLGVTHGNKVREPWNKRAEQELEAITKLVKGEYFDFNMTHCLEQLREKHDVEISYTSFRRLCHKEKMVKRKQRRRLKIRKCRVRMQAEGMLLQMDGSHELWNGKDLWVLIGAIDDATSDVPYAEFFKSEGTLETLKVMKRIVEIKGIPLAIYVDKATWTGWSEKHEKMSNFKRACDELGIQIIFAHSPQAKGRIERLWGTMQDRLIPELRFNKITEIEKANKYLQEEFLAKYWKQNKTIPAVTTKSEYRVLNKKIDLSELFCIKEFRKIGNDHTIRWENEVYQVLGDFKHSIAKRYLELRFYPDGTHKAFCAGKKVELKGWGMKKDYKLVG